MNSFIVEEQDEVKACAAGAALVFIDGSEAGGLWVDKAGGVHIIKPWQEDEALARQIRQLRAANSLLQVAQTSGDTELGRMAQQSGMSLVAAARKLLVGELGTSPTER